MLVSVYKFLYSFNGYIKILYKNAFRYLQRHLFWIYRCVPNAVDDPVDEIGLENLLGTYID